MYVKYSYSFFFILFIVNANLCDFSFIHLFFNLNNNNYSFNDLYVFVKKDLKSISSLTIAILLQPIVYNYFVLEFKSYNFDNLFFIEYYLMIGSMFASIILTAYSNNIFTNNYKPKFLDLLKYYVIYIIFSSFENIP